jgi:hypothetical protein
MPMFNEIQVLSSRNYKVAEAKEALFTKYFGKVLLG